MSAHLRASGRNSSGGLSAAFDPQQLISPQENQNTNQSHTKLLPQHLDYFLAHHILHLFFMWGSSATYLPVRKPKRESVTYKTTSTTLISGNTWHLFLHTTSHIQGGTVSFMEHLRICFTECSKIISENCMNVQVRMFIECSELNAK